MNTRNLILSLHQERLGVARLAATDEIPSWAHRGPFVSISRSAEELTVVCLDSAIPRHVLAERGWRCFEIEGELDFALTGVLTSVLVPLAEAKVSVFAVSTFNTDYILVKQDVISIATEALVAAGHVVQPHP